MEYAILGKTGLNVSRLGLGGAPLAGDFGKDNKAEAIRLIHAAIDSGVNFIDTAPKYGSGESERRIGMALAEHRHKVVLASKATRHDRSYDFATTIQSVEGSLQRLRTDWIDILQIHDVEDQDFDVVVNNTLPALEKLRDDGKIRFIGVTTRDLPLLMNYMNLGRLDTIQFYARYMLIDHTAKDEVIPLAKELNLGVINGSVLGLGMLADAPAPFVEKEIAFKASKRMKQLNFLRKQEPKGLVEPGMRFSLGNMDIHVSLTGVSSVSSLSENLSYCDGNGLEPEDLRRVYSLFQGQSLYD